MILRILRLAIYELNHLVNRLILYLHNVKFGRNVKINGLIYIRNKGQIVIGDNVIINSGRHPIGGQLFTKITVYSGGFLKIGDNVGISNSSIVVQTRVEIERGAMIGSSCNIWDTDFHSIDSNVRGRPEDRGASAPVFIGESAFIGAHSILLKSSHIGARAIVGAGSVGSLKVADDKIFVRR